MGARINSLSDLFYKDVNCLFQGQVFGISKVIGENNCLLPMVTWANAVVSQQEEVTFKLLTDHLFEMKQF